MNNEKKGPSPHVFVLGIDGVPFSFLKKRMAAGRFPNFSRLLESGDMKRMSTVLPPVSSVAWTSFSTGRSPAGHGIFGFVDRDPATMEFIIPTAKNIKAPSLWEILGNAGYRVVAMNVPISYPPRKVNGKLISCFLSTDLFKATYPPSLSLKLKEIGYVIDVDPWKARQDRAGFMSDLFHALEKRLETTLWLLKSEQPDFMISHIMETDRISHFFWENMEKEDPEWAPLVHDFFDKLDDFIGAIVAALPPETTLIILSDHGFCTLEKEVFINVALREAGFLKLTGEGKNLLDIHPDSTAYSMIPGRFFINLKGREKDGCVLPGKDYEEVRNALTSFLLSLKDPENGKPIISEVFKTEDVYKGPHISEAADLIAIPHNGYDIKGNLTNPTLTIKGPINGMHTVHDAVLYVRGKEIQNVENLNILDVAPSILSLYKVETAALNLDGRRLF